MILNARDWQKARATIKAHQNRIDFLSRRYANPREAAGATAEIQRLEMRIAELSQRIRLYDGLLQGSIHPQQATTLQSVPESFIARRIHARITQEELAKQIGVAPRTLARYESTFYSCTPFNCMMRIEATLRQIERDKEKNP